MAEPTQTPDQPQKKKAKMDKMLILLGVVLLAMLAVTFGSSTKKPATPVANPTAEQSAMVDTNVPPAPATETPAAQTIIPDTPATQINPAFTSQSEPATETTASTPAAASMQPVGKTVGDRNAPIKIVEFASLTCGHCAHFHNDTFAKLKEKYIDTGKVFFEFREFPLNKPAFDATLLANCLPENQYYGFITMLFQTQDHWAFQSDYLTPLKQNAKLAGMTDETIETCLNDTAAQDSLAKRIEADVKKYKLASTPTFIVNDGEKTIMGAQPLDGFSAVIDPLLAGQTAPETVIPADTATQGATVP